MPDVNITPTEDGPYMVSGPVVLTAPDGRVIEHADPIVMCRCGHSSNKPSAMAHTPRSTSTEPWRTDGTRSPGFELSSAVATAGTGDMTAPGIARCFGAFDHEELRLAARVWLRPNHDRDRGPARL